MSRRRTCSRCGKRRQCPARSRICRKCGNAARVINGQRQRKRDPSLRFHVNVRSGVRDALKRGWRSKYVDDVDALRRHLEATIPKGYTWDDYVEGHLELDHIRSVSQFPITSVDDPAFRECWGPGNLRLLPKRLNRRRNTDPPKLPARAPKPIVTPKEIGELLGVHRQTVYGWIDGGELPAKRQDGRWRIAWRDFKPFYKDYVVGA